jgi:hypothetical protein
VLIGADRMHGVQLNRRPAARTCAAGYVWIAGSGRAGRT